jgi:hypothetical protein
MLSIRCGGDSPEVELSATPAEFEHLSVAIARLTSTDAHEFYIEAAQSDPCPYERCLGGLRIVKAFGPLTVSVSGSSLLVSGGPAALSLFARNLPAEPGLPPGYHVHFEAIGRELMVSPGSAPLVLCVADDPRA